MKAIDNTSKPFPLKSRYYIMAGSFILILLAMASCKKSRDEEGKPVFGTCKSVAAKGHLSYSNATNIYNYTTSGGGHIEIKPGLSIVISHDSYPGFTIELWGSVANSSLASFYHENVNGTHIKDRLGMRRTIIFPDGARITFYTNELTGPALSITIYDGEEVHHINPTCNTIEYSTTHSAFANELDEEEPDGEAGTFEFTSTGLVFVDIYTENTAGVKMMNRVPLAEINRSNPGQVNDLFP